MQNPHLTEITPSLDRVNTLRRLIKDLDAILITKAENIRYLSGFTGSSAVALITKDKAILITDFRYKEMAYKEVKGWDIKIESELIPAVLRLSDELHIKKLGFEGSLPYKHYALLEYFFEKLLCQWDIVERIRTIKSAEEISLIKEAIRRAEVSYLEVLPHIKKGVSELSISLRLEEALKRNGSRKLPFDVIVASGPNSAMPHARPTERKLSPGDLVIIDWGAEAGGYFSDMTRTLFIDGKERAKAQEIYSIVSEAATQAINAISEGVRIREIDKKARDVIKKAGYGKYFGHATGHGVGLEVHEEPRIFSRAHGKLKSSMVLTVEPGIYIPGFGGVRIENMVEVGKEAKVLTSLPNTLKIIV